MKQWMVVLVSMCFGIMAFGNRISETEARIVAVNWFNSLGNGQYSEDNIQSVFSRSANDTLLLFVVTFKPNGWVLVSATDKVEPVLGYSTSSSFNINHLPIQMEEWMSGIQREIIHANSNKYLPKTDLIHKWAQSKAQINEPAKLKSALATTVGPLVQCTWDQGKYYNEMAPYDVTSSTGNNHVWIGCVATAMAQIMKHWEYPASGMGSFSYIHPVYGLQSANFGAAEYNWNYMPNHATQENSEVQEICYHVAVSIQMDFDPQGSGAYLDNARNAFIDYFKYNSTIFEASKSDWNESEWKNLLKNEINSGRPIVYSGYNNAGNSGHAFICDGYTNDYFHFNWGWGGYANGNFLLSALTPAGTNYSFKQVALLGIEPIEISPIDSSYFESFEKGTTPDYLNLSGVTTVSSVEKHSGANSLELSKAGFSANSINCASLAFLVPNNGHLSFWVKRNTPSVSGKNQQSATILTQFGQTVLKSIFNGDFTDQDWVNYSVDLSSYQGQVVRLMITQQNFDVVKEQWMYVDDIVVTGGQNLAPFVPSMPLPDDASKKVALTPQLSWSGGDMNGDSVVYSIYFGTNNNPPLLGTSVKNQFSPGALNHSTTYYWKVIAGDGKVQSESPMWSFTTRDLPPDMSLCGVSNIGQTTATVCGQIIDSNNSTITSLGICWGLSANVSVNSNTIVSTNTSSPYSCELSNLMPYSTYYIKSYAESSEGLAYSGEQSFQTLPGLPVVSSNEVSNIRRTSATASGVIQKKNDAAVLKCGVAWSAQQGFDPVDANTIYQSGSWAEDDSFWIDLINLPGPASIYYRTFAENSAGRSYSKEDSFKTFNTAPNIDLDSDNSSFVAGNQFSGVITEQLLDGHIADVDALISDVDNDTITEIKVVIQKQFNNEREYLRVVGEHPNLEVWGDGTDTLILSASHKILSLGEWNDVLQNIVFYVDEDEPGASFVRKVAVWVSDGFDQSAVAEVLLTVRPVNDAPVNIVAPKISGEAEINSTLMAIAGIWNDVLDQTNCVPDLQYQWQAQRNGEIFDIDGAASITYTISAEFCSDSIRVVETAIDMNCGGTNEASASNESEWVVPQKAAQTLTFDPIPSQTYTKIPFVLNGYSSSNLALTYEMNSSEVAHLLNDTVFIDAVGKVAISGRQEGNECYLPSETIYRMLTVNSGTQYIVCDSTVTLSYANRFVPVFAKSSVGLPLRVESSDSSIAVVWNDTIYFQNIGTVMVAFSQEGNEYVTAAKPVTVTLTIEKGQQLVSVNMNHEHRFGDDPFDINVEINSDLPPLVEISDTTILRLNNGLLEIVGVGYCKVTISQPGNEFYYPANDVTYDIYVAKGDQQLNLEFEREVRYGIGELPLTVQTNSNLPVEFVSTDTAVIKIENGKPYVAGVGQTSLIVSNSGNKLWNEISEIQSITVLKGLPEVEVPDTIRKHFGDADFELPVIVENGLPTLKIEIANSEVITEQNGLFSIQGLGETYVLLSQPGNHLWESFADSVYISVSKGIQTITFNKIGNVTYGDSALTLMASTNAGLEVLFESSNLGVAAINGSVLTVLSAGETMLRVNQAGNDFWEPAEPDSQLLIVNKAMQFIICDLSDTLFVGDHFSSEYFSVSSALPVTEIRSSNNQIMKVDGTEISILTPGQATLTVVQTGNLNYESQEQNFDFVVTYPLNAHQFSDNIIHVFPNPATNQIRVTISGNANLPLKLRLINSSGQLIQETFLHENDQIMDVSKVPDGLYLLEVTTIKGLRTVKLVVE